MECKLFKRVGLTLEQADMRCDVNQYDLDLGNSNRQLFIHSKMYAKPEGTLSEWTELQVMLFDHYCLFTALEYVSSAADCKFSGHCEAATDSRGVSLDPKSKQILQ